VTTLPAQRGPTLHTTADWPWYFGYIRVSTWKEEKISPELQEQAIRAWAARAHVRIVEPLVVDLDMTGRNFNRRIMECIEGVEQGLGVGVAVWKFSRFGRSRDGVALNLKRLEDAGGQLASATEEGDARTATGRLQRGILFEFAAYESDVRGEQWRETFDHRHYKLHLPATGRPRFGYLWTPRIVPDPTASGGVRIQEERYDAHPEQGPVMADRYRQSVDGEPFRSLVLNLNAAGWRTVRGGLWSEQTLIRYMDSGFCAGLLRVHNPQCGCSGKKRRNCQNMVFIPGAQEELISAELWQAYTERRAEQRATPPRARTPLYPLTNLVRCGACRGTAPAASKEVGPAGERRSIRGYAYHCGRRTSVGPAGCVGLWIKRAEVEAEVTAWLRREGSRVVDEAQPVPQPEPAEDRRAQAAQRQVALQAEHDRLAAALTNLRVQRAADPDDWGPGEYEAARDKIRAQQAEVTAQMENAAAVVALPDRADFQPEVVSLAVEWDACDYAQRNRILRQLLRRVILTRTSEGVTVEIEPMWEADRWAEPASSRA
jgi:hypothetical protein